MASKSAKHERVTQGGFHQEEAEGHRQPRKLTALHRDTLFRILSLARPHIGRLLLATACVVISSLTYLVIPYAMRLLVDTVFVHHDTSQLNRMTALLLVMVVVTAAFSFGQSYLLSYVGGRIVADLRLRLYRHLLDLPLTYFDEQRAGDLISRLAADTTLVQEVASSSLLAMLQNTILAGGILIVVVLLNWRLALVMLALAPLVLGFGYLLGRRLRRLSQQAQEELGNAAVVLEETLSAMRVVKAFVGERLEAARYGSSVEALFGTQFAAARIQALFSAAVLTIIFAALTAILWIGGREVLAGRLSPGGLVSFLFYLMIWVGPVQSLGTLYGSFQHAAGGAARIFEVLDTPVGVVDGPDAYPLPPVHGRVEVRDVQFSYAPDGPDVLTDVSVQAEPGEVVAIVGPSGAGKTTLVSLLPRFYQVTAGRISIDGHDITGVTMESLRRCMAIVPQESSVFGRTVQENIAYGGEGATQEEIETAARAARADEFIARLPRGYDTVVGDRGVKLSRGERQRIAIARAILKDPRILILDEATSSLDNESEALVQEALEQLMVGRTTFVIAHRLTTIENANRIIVLDRGRIVEQGTHGELMARDTLYRRLYTRSFHSVPDAIEDAAASLLPPIP